MKDPFLLGIYAAMLQDVQPRSVVELGSYEGGSALWLADQARALDLTCRVVTCDHNIERIRVNDPAVEVLPFDAGRIEKTLPPSFWATLERPLVVIEDAHANLPEVLRYVDSQLSEGDYLIVEDTIDGAKYQSFSAFLSEHRDGYLVDTWLCDFYGYNMSWNVNSFLKKTSREAP